MKTTSVDYFLEDVVQTIQYVPLPSDRKKKRGGKGRNDDDDEDTVAADDDEVCGVILMKCLPLPVA